MTTPSDKAVKASPLQQPYFYNLETTSLSKLDGRAEKFLAAFTAILNNSNY